MLIIFRPDLTGPKVKAWKCMTCGKGAPRAKWLPGYIGEVDRINQDLAGLYQRLGVRLADSESDPDRRRIDGSLLDVQGLSGMATGGVTIFFERAFAVLIIGDTSNPIVVPYDRLRGLRFAGRGGVTSTKTSIESIVSFEWDTGSVTIGVSKFLPAQLGGFMTPVLRRMESAAQAAQLPAAQQPVAFEDLSPIEQSIAQAQAAFAPEQYRAAVLEGSQALQPAAEERQATRQQVKAVKTAANDWPDSTKIIGAKLTMKASDAVKRLCHGDQDAPWLIMISDYKVGGLLAAWDDRLAIVKAGGWTSWAAGAMGGERTATFHFVDITGIEYNSGISNGVLEVLTPSYNGTANRDFWRTGKSTNSDSNDPFTLSNTLPLSKRAYQGRQHLIGELRSRIAKAKQPAVVVQGTQQAPPDDLVARLTSLASLRDSGALTDAEFEAAKARIINS